MRKLLGCLVICFLGACSGNADKEKNPVSEAVKKDSVIPLLKQDVKPGMVYSSIKCDVDTLQTYAVYLPANYNTSQKYPIVYFFDAHAAGSLPVEKYKTLADEYGYILAGSNNSKNGLEWEQTNVIVNNFLADAKSRFNVDLKRVFTGGFSGGSRVAVSVALSYPEISGVVGCGAGFPNVKETIERDFAFVGIVGNEDFNLQEMMQLDAQLNNTPIKHFLSVFDGKHEWPGLDVMADAFRMFDLTSAKKDPLYKDVTKIDNYKKAIEPALEKLSKSKGQEIEYLLELKKAYVMFNGLVDISTYQNDITKLMESKQFRTEVTARIELDKQEVSTREELLSALTTKEFNWWNLKVKSFNNHSKSNKKLSQMYKRVQAYLSLATYMNTSSALKAADLEAAEKLATVYAIIDPENSEAPYLLAVISAAKGKTDDALRFLKQALKLGFKEKERALQEPAFKNITQTPAFQEIFKGLNVNA